MRNPFHHWANSSLVAIGGVNRLGNGVGIDHLLGGTQSFGPTHHLHCIIASQSISTSHSSTHFAMASYMPLVLWKFMELATGQEVTVKKSKVSLLQGLDLVMDV
jgi:hypothetical protein